MFSNLNKQVTAKFRSTRNKVASKPNQPKTPPATTIMPVRSARMGAAVDLSSNQLKPGTKSSATMPRNQVKPQPEPQPTKPPAKSTTSCTGSEGEQRLKIKSANNVSSRMRAEAATLPRNSQSFPLSKRVFRPSASKIFDYDLSKEEKRYFGQYHNPMKSVPAEELQLLKTGQRTTYLETRYAHTPDAKYNYPEATSWRYGWFHRKDAVN
ncbi:uncharacterized protein [Drosophila virilis]|uniref:Sperm microtubule inner protein 1 C-terminal domain-containing protein n=1 Tax=Drosophila virilis TaxID=7244 RepID=B4LKF6_DROVI|nr:uncharacterized protein LOC6625238 [Drosophila virilis]EDW60677.2 uncharacterized protein Dvir_GJ21613 [Drosophila virilis]